MFKRIAGTKDILPEEGLWWQHIEAISRDTFSLYNYQEIRPPLIEEALLFDRSLGESTEIIRKQMFLVKKDKDTYALRPEGTASVVRAYIENNLDKTAGFVKFYYLGPMFRLERPQKGRLRQFHHIGCEAIGSSDAGLDVEAIALADSLLKGFSVSGYKIELNSLGCSDDKKKLTQELRKSLKDELPELCADCKVRFKQNVLRVMDCKNQKCIEVVRGLGIRDAHLCPECRTHIERVKDGLRLLNIEYEYAPCLVRGLDYYNRTVFEVTHRDLGAQDALGAGGRYDNLVKGLGGPDVGAVGFALGVERISLVASHKSQVISKPLVFIIPLGEAARKESLKLLAILRQNGISADTDYEGKSLKGALRRADDLKAKHVLIIGEDELKKKVVTLKDMESGEQREVAIEDLINELKQLVT